MSTPPFIKPTSNDLIRDGAAAIANNADAALSLRWWQGPQTSPTVDVDTVVTPGRYSFTATPADWAAQHYPTSGQGILTVTSVGSGLIQEWVSFNQARPRSYVRIRYAGTWGAWREMSPSTYTAVAAGTDLATLTPGLYGIASVPTNPAAQNYPAGEPVRGWLEVRNITGTVFGYVFHEMAGKSRMWTTTNYAGFRPWTLIGPTAIPNQPATTSAAGWKVAGIPVTAGHAGTDATLTGGVRIPLNTFIPATVTTPRARLRIVDINSRTGVTRPGTITATVTLATIDPATGAISDPVPLATDLTFDGAAGWTSPWFAVPSSNLANKAVCIDWSKATAPWAMLATAWQTPNGDADNPAADATRIGTAPFSIDVQAEVAPTVPILGVFGDSNSVGVGTTLGLAESWPTRLAAAIGAVVVHYGASGATIAAQNTGTYPWTRNADCARPDALLVALGQNDAAATDAAAATITAAWDTFVQNVTTLLGPSVYAVSLLPRTTDPTPEFETIRQSINAHMAASPLVRDYLDIIPAVSTDGLTLTPTAAAADGIHLAPAGTQAVASLIHTGRPLLPQQV